MRFNNVGSNVAERRLENEDQHKAIEERRQPSQPSNSGFIHGLKELPSLVFPVLPYPPPSRCYLSSL
jgi:hypothetical protein